jgi:hypothetical protein
MQQQYDTQQGDVCQEATIIWQFATLLEMLLGVLKLGMMIEK